MAAKTPILVIGATGYIGGTVLHKLLTHPSASAFDITTLVRDEAKAKKLEKQFGVHGVVGTYKDTALVKKLAKNAHVVFSLADAEDLVGAQAILKGLKQRHTKLGDVPILIHTSGTGILIDGLGTKGMAVSDVVYDDSNFAQIASIPPTAYHIDVDRTVMEASNEGYCRTYTIIPGTIYGIAQTPLVAAGIQKAHSFQIPALIHASLGCGHAGMVGQGLARWPDVHVDDVADLYIVLYDAIVARGADSVDHGVRGTYFIENGEHAWADIAQAIGRAMVGLGLSASAEPTAFSDEELAKFFGSVEMGNSFGTNARCRATHSRALGWKPRYTTEDMVASIKPEVEAILKQQQGQKQ